MADVNNKPRNGGYVLEGVRQTRENEFQPPARISEALERRSSLLEAIQDIELQLGTAQQRYDDPQELDSWRNKAKTALRVKQREYRYLGRWIKAARRMSCLTGPAAPIDPGNPRTYVRASYDLLVRLKSDGVELRPEELAILQEIREFLEGLPAVTPG